MSELCRRQTKCAASATSDVTVWWADVTSGKCRDRRRGAGWAGWHCCQWHDVMTQLAANWLVEGGARRRVVGPAIAARRRARRRPDRRRWSVAARSLLPSSLPCVALTTSISTRRFHEFVYLLSLQMATHTMEGSWHYLLSLFIYCTLSYTWLCVLLIMHIHYSRYAGWIVFVE